MRVRDNAMHNDNYGWMLQFRIMTEWNRHRTNLLQGIEQL